MAAAALRARASSLVDATRAGTIAPVGVGVDAAEGAGGAEAGAEGVGVGECVEVATANGAPSARKAVTGEGVIYTCTLKQRCASLGLVYVLKKCPLASLPYCGGGNSRAPMPTSTRAPLLSIALAMVCRTACFAPQAPGTAADRQVRAVSTGIRS